MICHRNVPLYSGCHLEISQRFSCIYIYIYIYIAREKERKRGRGYIYIYIYIYIYKKFVVCCQKIFSYTLLRVCGLEILNDSFVCVYIYIYRERESEREKGKNMCVSLSLSFILFSLSFYFFYSSIPSNAEHKKKKNVILMKFF